MTREEWGIREADIRHALEDLWYSTNRFSAEDYCRLCAGEISVNDIRSKLGLAPLQSIGCDDLVLIEPTGYIPLVRLDYVRKAREYGEASESAAVRDFFERSRDFADQNISSFLSP